MIQDRFNGYSVHKDARIRMISIFNYNTSSTFQAFQDRQGAKSREACSIMMHVVSGRI